MNPAREDVKRPRRTKAEVERGDAGALRERELRKNLEPHDLTAAILGDPLPGYSALDRQR